MDVLLNAVEVRALGALIEKEITTPEYYPLTLNSVTTACNQKSNRDPVVSLEERAVVRALEGLREKGLARQVSGVDTRVPKHYHLFDEKMRLTPPQVAALCVLLLRGLRPLVRSGVVAVAFMSLLTWGRSVSYTHLTLPTSDLV